MSDEKMGYICVIICVFIIACVGVAALLYSYKTTQYRIDMGYVYKPYESGGWEKVE